MLKHIRIFILKIIRKYFSKNEFDCSELEILSSLLKLNGISSVYSERTGLNLPVDNIILPRVLSNQYCEGELPEEFKGDVFNGCAFIDIGANVGVAAIGIIKIIKPSACFLYEPDPFCFKLLKNNVSLLVNNETSISIKNAGIGSEDSKMDLFVDTQNAANNSLIRSSIPTIGRLGDVHSVEVVGIEGESINWISDGRKIFYMSDTQGMDETIFSLIPPPVLDCIIGGMVEIFSLEGKEFSQSSFSNNMSVFSKFWIRRDDDFQRITFENLLKSLNNSWCDLNRSCYDVIFLR